MNGFEYSEYSNYLKIELAKFEKMFIFDVNYYRKQNYEN